MFCFILAHKRKVNCFLTEGADESQRHLLIAVYGYMDSLIKEVWVVMLYYGGTEKLIENFIDFDSESYYNMLWAGIFMPKGSIMNYTLNDGKGDVIILRRSVKIIMGESISRTAGNVYNKEDKDTWLVLPKKKEYTSFVNVSKLTISQQEEDIDPEDIDFPALISKIRRLDPQITDHE
ncbi:MAG: hypothetical protein HFG32_02655 [Eubacterium sp.]|nr:hypothetical protein [Eubacterium sp.]